MKYIAIINSDEPLTEHMIQEIKDTAFCGDDQTPYVFDIEKILNMAEVPRWIPVSERLPKQGESVICQCRANMIKVLKLDADFDWYQDADHCYMNGFVITWMPLPEPYKQLESEVK
jgi:hypothetical protein